MQVEFSPRMPSFCCRRSLRRGCSEGRAGGLILAIVMAAMLGACGPPDSQLDLQSTPRGWADQRAPSGFQKLAEPQPPCRDCLAFERVAVIGEESGPGILSLPWQSGVVDRHGNYWAGQGGTIKVFNPDGTFLRDIGRGGQGPLEFQNARPIFSDADGNVHIFDSWNARETIISSSFTLVDTRRTWQAGDEISPLPGGRYAISKWIATPERIAFPLHVIEGMEIIRSLGIPADAEQEPLTRHTAERLVTTDAVGHILSIEPYRYLIEAWTMGGIRIMGLQGPRLNDHEIPPGPLIKDAKPPPLGWIWDIRIYDRNRLWVLSGQRKENWRDAAWEEILPDGRIVLHPVDGLFGNFYRSRIDIIDLNTATLIASGTVDRLFIQLLDGHRVVEDYPTEEGDWRVAIWKIDLMSN